MKYAFIENGAVREVIEPFTNEEGRSVPIEERFSADFVARLLPLPEGSEAAAGWAVNEAGEFSPPPAPDTVAEEVVVRAERDRLLSLTDWSQLPDVPQATRELWAPYRQELRNVPQQKGFPKKVKWPTPPVSG